MVNAKEIQSALFAIGEAARNAERRCDDLGDHSISPEEAIAVRDALALIERYRQTATPALLRRLTQ